MDVDRGTVDGAVAQPGLQGKKVQAILITVGSVSVAEGVRAKACIQAKRFPAVKNDLLEPLLIHRPVPVGLLGKQPGFGLHMDGAGIPVLPDMPADALRDGDVTVGMVFGYRDIKPVRRKGNIAAFQMAEFIQPQTGSIKDGAGEARLRVVKGLQEACDLSPVGDEGQVGAELPERDL